MVFTLEEDLNQPAQVMLPKGKQTKQRKNSGTPRKGKAVGVNSAVKHKKSSKSAEHLLPTAVGCSPVMQNEMGNITSILSPSDDVKKEPEMTAAEDESLNSTKPVIQTCDSTNQIPEQRKKKLEIKNNSKPMKVPSAETMEVSEPQMDFLSTTPDAGISIVQVPNDLSSEVIRLKQLLLLQVSLISRQQDLLRLRDREIMQLKASNQNYKCQLNRVRRRMSTKKEYPSEEAAATASAQPNRKLSGYVECSVTSTTKVPGDKAESSERMPVFESMSETLRSDLSKAAIQEDPSHKDAKRQRLDSKCSVDFAGGSTPNISHALENETDVSMVTPLKTPQNEKNKVPVPLSFIERRQNQLIEALMASPPEKALKNFCSIADSPSPSNVGDVALADFPFKICDRCPHCVAIAAEITRLIKIAQTVDGVIKPTLPTKQDIELLKLASVDLPKSENEDSDPSMTGKTNHILRTTVSYFRHSPTFDQDHWWWDLKCGDLKTENKLNIPTWKEKHYAPAQACVDPEDENAELTDDITFTKRHNKYELDERRRKRWDIQRIREYRYNEKLRQKLLKQAAIYEAPVIETFSGHLHDAESVEVHGSLPVNVFGYPAPHIEPEEFHLTPMYQMSKVLAAGSGRRKSKKIV